MKKIVLFMVLAFLCLSAFSGQAIEIPSSLSEFLLPEDKVSFEVGLTIDEMNPYGKEMLSALNQLLPHLSLSADMAGEEGRYAIMVDEMEAAFFSQTIQDGKQILLTDMLPNRILYSEEDVLTSLLSEKENDEVFSFHLNEALDEVKQYYPMLEEAIAPYAEDKKANYSIKKIGKAQWVRLARLTKDQSEELYDELFAVITSGLNEAYCQTLSGILFQKALTVAFYYTEENGDLLSVYIKGNVKHPNGNTLALAYQFSFTDERKIYKLELGKGKRGGVSVDGDIISNINGQSYSFNMEIETSFKSLDGKATRKNEEESKLKGEVRNGIRSIEGTIELIETIEKEKKQKKQTDINLALMADGSQLTGDAKLILTSNKDKITNVTVSFSTSEKMKSDTPKESTSEEGTRPEASDNASASIIILEDKTAEENLEAENPAESTTDDKSIEFLVGKSPTGMKTFTANETSKSIDLTKCDEEELCLLQEELYQNLSAKLLLNIFTYVPQKDLTLLADNTDEQGFLDLLEKLYSVR